MDSSYLKAAIARFVRFVSWQKSYKDSFLSLLSGPARRTLENNKTFSLEELTKFSENEILKFHGMGKAPIPKLRRA